MNTPKDKTKAPARRWPTGRRSHLLTELAAKPNTKVNTIVKPMMKRRIGTAAPRLPSSGACPPETNATYPGTRGRTHGEAQETVPAAKANAGAHQARSPVSTISEITPTSAFRSEWRQTNRLANSLHHQGRARNVRDSKTSTLPEVGYSPGGLRADALSMMPQAQRSTRSTSNPSGFGFSSGSRSR